MDVGSLLTLLLLALALAIQPWSVLASVLLIASTGGFPKALAYVAGWVLAPKWTARAHRQGHHQSGQLSGLTVTALPACGVGPVIPDAT
ncbi:MAG TPA: hypothetical protein VES02_04660 [Dermatophilaceae bacterium]|nr:hypothetical protein [Dermatophilaceae bacterium]